MLVSFRMIFRVVLPMRYSLLGPQVSQAIMDWLCCGRYVSASVLTRHTVRSTPAWCPDTQTEPSRRGWESSAVLASRRISSSSWAWPSWWRGSCAPPGTWPAGRCWGDACLSSRTTPRIWWDQTARLTGSLYKPIHCCRSYWRHSQEREV